MAEWGYAEREYDEESRIMDEGFSEARKRIVSETKEAEKKTVSCLSLAIEAITANVAFRILSRNTEKMTESDRRAFFRIYLFNQKEWKDAENEVLSIHRGVDSRYMDIIRRYQERVFRRNYNRFAMAFGFSLFDVHTLRYVLKENPKLLPSATVNKKKRRLWFRTKLNNCIWQSVINGDSIDDLAKNICKKFCDLSMNTVIRYARTAMTSAQNAGRIEAMREAQRNGINIKKRWLSTHDSRVRDSHIYLDGQIREVNESFQSLLGEIMFPGDPEAKPGDVWNCRCTLVCDYPDY